MQATPQYDDGPTGVLRSVTQVRDGRTISQLIEVSPFKTITIDEQGIATTTLTDALGRVTSVVVAAYGDQPARSTVTIYLGRFSTTIQSAGGIALTSTGTQNLLGRAISRTDATDAMTATAYPNNGRDTSVTHTGGNTLATTRTIDALTVSTTGTAAVNEFWSYAILGGQLLTTRRSGAGNSGRLVRSATDGAGRLITAETPSPANDCGTITVTTGFATGTRRAISRTSSAANTAPQLSTRPAAGSSRDTSRIGVYLGYGLFVSAMSKIGKPTPVGNGGALIKFIPATIDAKKKIVLRSTK